MTDYSDRIASDERIHLERLTKECVDKGHLIEAGWIGLRLAAVGPNATPKQVEELRTSFFAGAQHLFGSIITILEPGDETTEHGFRQIDAELKSFIEDFRKQHQTEGDEL